MEAHILQVQSNNTEIDLIKRLLHALVREQLLPHSVEDNTLKISLKKSETAIIANDVISYQLGKFKIRGDVFLVVNKQAAIIKHVDDLLQEVHSELSDKLDSSQWQRFVAEIKNCNRNSELVDQHVSFYNQRLLNQIVASKCKTLIEFIKLHYSVNKQLTFFETWTTKGHPYHPCHKTRLGFDENAYIKFSPEFNQDIQLPLGAIKKSVAHVEHEQENMNYNDWFARQYPVMWINWLEELQKKSLPITEYYPIFIHPWQYENTLTKLFADLITNKNLIIFEHIQLKTHASLSFRTLIPHESDLPHIKLPVAVHSTSAMRTISPASVHNGPMLSRMIRKILFTENNFAHHIKLAYESCGLHVKHDDADIAKHLGIIYRSNPTNLVAHNQMPIVVAGLFEESPVKKRPIFIELLQMVDATLVNDAKAYFNNYCKIVIRAYLDLFLIYGIALEGHQQNTIAVFENYYPKFMIARDLGGLRIHEPTLRQHGFEYQAHPDSVTLTEDDQEVTNKFLHTVIQYHLGELVLLLANHFQTDENEFWQIIKTNLIIRFNDIKEFVDENRWHKQYQAILKNDWEIKSLLRMRLSNVYNKYIYINLKNPLRDI